MIKTKFTKNPVWLSQIPEVTALDHLPFRVLFLLLGLSATSPAGLVDVNISRLARHAHSTPLKTRRAIEDLDNRGRLVFDADEGVVALAATLFGLEVSPVTSPGYAKAAIVEFRDRTRVLPPDFTVRWRDDFLAEMARCHAHLQGCIKTNASKGKDAGGQNLDACNEIEKLFEDLGPPTRSAQIRDLAADGWGPTQGPPGGPTPGGTEGQYSREESNKDSGRRGAPSWAPAPPEPEGGAS